MNRRYDVCIIGGGAAGLAAAASLDRKIRTCIIEKNQILGRKILATGGGRCNLTNAGCEGVSATLDFFAMRGLATVQDEQGRYYPYSGCASDVVKVLEDAVRDRGCDVFTGYEVRSVEGKTPGGGFRVHARSQMTEAGGNMLSGKDADLTVTADNLLIAAGGKAAPQFGTTGDGYRLAKSLGHQVSRLYPILTGIECGDMRDIHGIRARGAVTLLKDGQPIAAETGEIQFTKDGLSGICVFNLTPYIHAEDGERPSEAFRRFELLIDLAPDFTQEEIDARGADRAGRPATFGILTEKLAVRVGPDRIKGWRLPVLGIKGWRSAQCTAGGILLDEIDPACMESRLVPGLYFAGEILDIQGPCGGYNLQNAWETGLRAAEHINRRQRNGDKDRGEGAQGH